MMKHMHLTIAAILCVSLTAPVMALEKPTARAIRDLTPLATTITGAVAFVKMIKPTNDVFELKVGRAIIGGVIGLIVGGILTIIVSETDAEIIYRSSELNTKIANRYAHLLDLLQPNISTEEFSQRVHTMYSPDVHPTATIYNALVQDCALLSAHENDLKKRLLSYEKSLYEHQDIAAWYNSTAKLLLQLNELTKIIVALPCYQQESAAYLQEQLLEMQRRMADLQMQSTLNQMNTTCLYLRNR